MKRTSGVLMHVSSLFGDYSIGSLGREAMRFVDFLSDSGFSYWQVLPFCMTDECNSPYKSYSAFGFNPYFIDLPTLYEKGYIDLSELNFAKGTGPYLCEFERLKKERLPLLFLASERMREKKEERERLEAFLSEHPYLAEAARFLALRESNDGAPWQSWTVDTPDPDRLFGWQFIQYEFFVQWKAVKDYANKKGISIIGDVPIYVSLDSADVWANPDSFLLDKSGRPTDVAGVPPDYFSEEGQLWQNPLYNYKKMKQDGFSWWRSRIRHMLTLFDGVRIDHFRGFDAYWSVPATATSAKAGRWVKGPGRAIIDAIKEEAGDRLIIAEDLGDITDSVRSLLKYSGFPGMRVFQFAFLGDPITPHLPHNYINNTLAYTSTHDNNTLLGYLWECDPGTRATIFEYCGYFGDSIDEGCHYVIIELMRSSAGTVIMPIQDLLGFGSDTRMNTPGVANGNWAYRLTEAQLNSLDRAALRHLNVLYGRI